MSLRYNYNRQVSPPAPFLYVTISLPHDVSVAIPAVPALLDTGADTSVIPANVVEQLRLVQLGETPIAGYGGHIVVEPTYLIGIAVQPYAALTIPVVASREEAFVLLGRDALNQFEIVLDGPRLVFEIRLK
jgi:predicted aspartyl protease